MNNEKLELPFFLKFKRKIYEDDNFYLKKHNNKYYIFSKKSKLVIFVNKFDIYRTIFFKLYINFEYIDMILFQNSSFYFNKATSIYKNFNTFEQYLIILLEYFSNETLFSLINEFNLKEIIKINKDLRITNNINYLKFSINEMEVKDFHLFEINKNEYNNCEIILYFNNKFYFGNKDKFENFIKNDKNFKGTEVDNHFLLFKEYLDSQIYFFYEEKEFINLSFIISDRLSAANIENKNNYQFVALGKNKKTHIGISKKYTFKYNTYNNDYIDFMNNIIINSYFFKKELVEKQIIKEEEKVRIEHINLFKMVNY